MIYTKGVIKKININNNKKNKAYERSMSQLSIERNNNEKASSFKNKNQSKTNLYIINEVINKNITKKNNYF